MHAGLQHACLTQHFLLKFFGRCSIALCKQASMLQCVSLRAQA